MGEKASKAKIEVPGLIPQKDIEHLEYALAEHRRTFRKQREARVQEISSSVGESNPSAVSVPVETVSFTELVLPMHANHMGNTFGGQIMYWMAKASAAAVSLHLYQCMATKKI